MFLFSVLRYYCAGGIVGLFGLLSEQRDETAVGDDVHEKKKSAGVFFRSLDSVFGPFVYARCMMSSFV